MIVRRGDNIYDIQWHFDHQTVYRNGEFLENAENEEEAFRVIDEHEDVA